MANGEQTFTTHASFSTTTGGMAIRMRSWFPLSRVARLACPARQDEAVLILYINKGKRVPLLKGKATKETFFEKKTAKSLHAYKKSLTFAPHLEKCSFV